MRTQFSIMAVIGTDHLPFAEDGVAEQGVVGEGMGMPSLTTSFYGIL
jgi:hypothetical protein